MRLTARLTPASLALVAAACSSDGPGAPPQDVAPLDVGRLLGETSVPAAPSVAAMVPFGVSGAAPTLTVVPTSCPYDAKAQSFVCAPFTSNRLTRSIVYALYDAAGKPLATADGNVAASMRAVITATGTLPAPGGDGTTGSLAVAMRQDMTLSGLLTGTHKLDGTATTKLDGTITVGGVSALVGSTTTQTVAGLTLPTGAGASPWPTGGTVTTDLTTTATTSAAPTTLRMVMAFDGTSTATLTITSGGVTQRCTVNLASTGAAPVCTAG